MTFNTRSDAVLTHVAWYYMHIFIAHARKAGIVTQFSPNLAWTFRPRIPGSLLFLVKIGWQFRPYAHAQWICACKIRQNASKQRQIECTLNVIIYSKKARHLRAKRVHMCEAHVHYNFLPPCKKQDGGLLNIQSTVSLAIIEGLLPNLLWSSGPLCPICNNSATW